MVNKKKLIIMIITLVVIVLIGSSYALLRSSHKGSNPYTVNVGLLQIDFYGNTTNLTLSNAYPMTDEEGLVQNEELVFTIKNTGSIKANYKVYIEETSTNPEIKTVIRYVDKKGSNEYSSIKTLSEDNYIDKNGALNTKFRAGTKFIKFLIIYNYNNISDTTTDIKNIYFREVNDN